MEDLLPSLEDSKSYGELKKKIEKLNEKRSPAEKPLSAPVKDRISRKVCTYISKITGE
ncbi:MAG: hypothetical protein NXI00_24550 [Cytophagales bacterium]|nr:hypothetical protein [Cytophagales bacterium]